MEKESIAIVGGGMTGIASALELAKTGKFDVTIFEKEKTLGGLCSYYHWNDITSDRFYHVILPADKYLLEFIKVLDLESQLYWRSIKSGFYGDGKLVSMSSVMDFIRFPFLSLCQKVRLGLGILYSTRIKNPAKLDKIYAKHWLSKVFGKKVYENIWEPLLRSKLGSATDITAASFIWTIINRLYGARRSGKKQEKMGHVLGGYYTILTRAKRKLEDLNVRLMTNECVERIEYLPGEKQVALVTETRYFKFNKVAVTVACPEILRIVANSQNHIYWRKLESFKYLDIICVLLLIKRKLSPFYVVNLLDKSIPFTGIIESTNIISSEDLGNLNLIYLPKYMPHNDPLNNLSDEKICKLFINNLKKVFPDLKEEELSHIKVFREKNVQPLQEIGFLGQKIDFQTPLQNVYVVNSSMIYNSTLNNNAAIELARKATVKIINNYK